MQLGRRARATFARYMIGMIGTQPGEEETKYTLSDDMSWWARERVVEYHGGPSHGRAVRPKRSEVRRIKLLFFPRPLWLLTLWQGDDVFVRQVTPTRQIALDIARRYTTIKRTGR